MGIGDELMMAGEARRRAAGSARKYLMLDKRGLARWHHAWEGNPNIAHPNELYDGVIGYTNGRRPYMVDESPIRRFFRAYEPVPAFIQLNERAKALAVHAQGAVVFNPTIKPRAPPNKDWGLGRWKELVAITQGIRWVQAGESGAPRIRGVQTIQTATFLEACGLLAGARAVVVHEGALHHAAAALGVPAVVIRGGFVSPKVTGYAGQVDMYIESADYPLGCGMRIICSHCEAAMAAITPAAVAAALNSLLQAPVAA